MKTKDISDNEIKILGQEWQETEKSYLSKSDNHIRVQQKSVVSKISIILLSILLVTALLFIVYLLKNKAIPMEKTINDVPMTIYIPQGMEKIEFFRLEDEIRFSIILL
jgi:hypothetical protein